MADLICETNNKKAISNRVLRDLIGISFGKRVLYLGWVCGYCNLLFIDSTLNGFFLSVMLRSDISACRNIGRVCLHINTKHGSLCAFLTVS